MPPSPGQPTGQDGRTAAQLFRQWTLLQQTKKQLVEAGLLNGDATPAMILQKLREVLPIDLMA